MSHIVTIKTEVRDPAAVRAACTRLRLAEPRQGTVRLFTSSATGLIVQLPEWRYPVVCQIETGQVQFDNFENHWGDRVHLDRFLQAYTIERARLEARKQGYDVVEQSLVDGSIKLTIHVGGGSMKTIEITVDPMGASKIETKGFAGATCQQASRFLEQALGSRLNERLTDEFYKSQCHEQTNIARS